MVQSQMQITLMTVTVCLEFAVVIELVMVLYFCSILCSQTMVQTKVRFSASDCGNKLVSKCVSIYM
jgi:hypothetical protein